VVSPSERPAAAGAAERVDDTHESVDTHEGADAVDDGHNGNGGGRGGRAETAREGSARTVRIPIPDRDPVDLPEIVPATVDEPDEPAQPAPAAPSVVSRVQQRTTPQPATGTPRQDALDAWRTGSSTVVVPVPMGHTGRVAAPPVLRRRPRVRKVTRVVRHVDPWSTFKVALVFSVVLYGVLLTAGVLLWNVASNTGTIDNVERWFTQFGWETYELKGGEIYHNAWIAGLFGVIGLTGAAVLAATLFNLISDLVGGVRVTVLEEEVVERTTSRNERFMIRRPVEAAPPVAEFDLDGELDPPASTETASAG
jgi:hypothetical protein